MNYSEDALRVPEYSMEETNQTRAELIQELQALQHRVRELEAAVRQSQSLPQSQSLAAVSTIEAVHPYPSPFLEHLPDTEATNRLKNEFLAVLSHELRSPLNPILGWATMLRSHRLDERMTERALESIERNAKLQIQLIEDLLDVSQILQGKLHLNIAQVDLVAIAEAKSIQLWLAVDSPNKADLSIEVAGDAVRLQQIIWNLVSNAVKFTPAGGKVEVRLTRFTQPEAPTDQVEIEVRDTGKGIDAAFLPHIFEYFRQGDSAMTRQFGGLGLGLTIVRHLVELHGGSIQVLSEGEGKGATFRIWLPLLQSYPFRQRIEQPIPYPAISAAVDARIRYSAILVAEGDPDMREYLGFVLQEAGARVLLASSAGEVLAKLPRFQPDVLLLGLDLPNVDGYRLVRQIRSLVPELGGQVPAIALVGYTRESNQQMLLEAGFQGYLTKPVDPALLITTLANLLPKGHAAK
jgi:signal transduction histidine kinase/CheY-like chemotaxis protein